METAMRELVILAGLVACAMASPAAAQTWGQPHYRAPSVTWGQPHGGWGGGPTEWDGRAYAVTGHAATGYGPASRYAGYGDPRAYRAPDRHRYSGHDRGGRYGYSPGNRWTRWSSPPGRGYHDAYGYNDDRAPRGEDRSRHRAADCDCVVSLYLYDR
jgi:hypothetical protein